MPLDKVDKTSLGVPKQETTILNVLSTLFNLVICQLLIYSSVRLIIYCIISLNSSCKL